TRPLDRFTIRIFFLSIISRRSKEDFDWPMMFRTSGLDVNCPTLFWIAGVASAAKRSVYFANSSTQKDLTDVSVTLSTTFVRKALSDKTRFTPRSVEPGNSRSAKRVLFKI